MTTTRPMVVIKVGGSLLSLPDLPVRLESVIRDQRHARSLIVCGGGEVAEMVRRWHEVHYLTDEQAHELALRAMSMGEALLSSLLRDGVVVAAVDEIHAAWQRRLLPILACAPYLYTQELVSQQSLPHDWSATSDSIAAWVVRQLGGERLLLVKSCDLPVGISFTEAAEQGLVDACFPDFASGLTVSWVNLQADVPLLTEWHSPYERLSS